MFIRKDPILHSLLQSGVAVFLTKKALETKYGDTMVNENGKKVLYSKAALQKILVTLLLFNVGSITSKILYHYRDRKDKNLSLKQYIQQYSRVKKILRQIYER